MVNKIPNNGFAAGTLIHTQAGLVPVEQIKVGDYVLSKQKNVSEQAYKRVLKTFAHEPKTVMRVGYELPNKQNYIYKITSTLKHPFWVADKGWTAADDLPMGPNAFGEKLELANGSQVLTCHSSLIYVSDQPGVGWLPSYMGDLQRLGALWDFVNHRLVATDVMALQDIQDFSEEYDHPIYQIPERFLLKLPVFNLKVEDFHTYYAGEHGLWVLNT